MPARAPRAVLVTLVAATVVVVAMAAVAVLFVRFRGTAAAPVTSTQEPQAPKAQPLRCGAQECTQLAVAKLGTETVELLADAQGRAGRVRIESAAGSSVFETTGIQDNKSALTSRSLECVPGASPVCLVRISQNGESLGEVFVGRSGVWSRGESTYASTDDYLALRDITGDGTPEVVAVQLSCGDNPAPSCTKAFAQVFTLSGDEIGCTRVYPANTQLPGWPTVAPSRAQLGTCPS
ncbi:hypothetical protein GCM10010174_10710 [Kutzneria viridogrisea]|uniref:Uncharacterized protein n=1 Tax=Kutzneria viridogrisea TaxID=47990 RepID=A0ABR6BI71_9PSEU|nr:hypothetical protein [Kutzneria viridogrisea]